MSVQEQIPYVEYVGNGVTKAFPVTFNCDESADLRVTVNDIDTMVGDWVFIDEKINFTYPPVSESLIKIWRESKLERSTNYNSYNNSFRPDVVNHDFDGLWLVLQEFALKNNWLKDQIQNLFDQVVAGQVNGLPQEVLARIAGDEALKKLVNFETNRSVIAENNLNTIKANKLDVSNQLSKKSDISYVDSKIAGVANGLVASFKTFALADAAKSTLPVNSSVQVTNDPDQNKNGLYDWDGKSLTKSNYDPIAIAEKGIKDLELASMSYKGQLEDQDLNTLFMPAIYQQSLSDRALAELNYPVQKAGKLEVFCPDKYGQTFIYHTYKTFDGEYFYRVKYYTYPFQAWIRVADSSKVDKKIKDLEAKSFIVKNGLTTENLDTVLDTGMFRQLTDANSTVENNYPDTRAGTLEVTSINRFVTQTYTTWWGRKFWRTKYGSFPFQEWNEFAKKEEANLDTDKPYNDKTIAWFGDSIVNGNNHPNRVGVVVGAKTVHKFGFNSCTMSRNAGSLDGYDKLTMYRFSDAIATGDFKDVLAGAEYLKANNNQDFTPQAKAMSEMDWTKVDYIIIAFGTNDWAGSTPLGSEFLADSTGSTFIGAACHVVETILTKYPHIQIMFNGPVFRTRWFNDRPEQNSDTVTDAQGKYLVDYQDALIKVGEKYHVPVFDFYRKSGINILNYRQYFSDGVHPIENGTQLWTKKLAAFLLSN